MSHRRPILWLDEPEEHDYPAAIDYLDLVMTDRHYVNRVVDALRTGDIVHKKAKDILRASDLPLLPATNAHVAKDAARIEHGTPLSPVLLVRGRPLIIADGYHRVCAVYHGDENAEIPCKLV